MTTQNERLARLSALGQSVWLDYISRKILDDGELARLVAEDSVTGVTSNPAIFEKSIRQGSDYDAVFAALPPSPAAAQTVYEGIALADIRAACDVLRPVYDRTSGADGFASLEVSPELAHDTEGTLVEARRLWQALDRPNAMIKVPATAAGVPAVQQLIREGINVNVTLLFARSAYEKVAEAYVAGLTARAEAGEPVAHVASVASFFVSRIDSAVDSQLEKLGESARPLLGRIAIANAKLAYASYQQLYAGSAWQALAARGARPQRLLWASTGTKNPNYGDVLYVEELIGPETVNTMPPETLRAFADHGRAEPTLLRDLAGAEQLLSQLAATGISLDAITDAVLADGVKKFTEPFAALLGSIEERLARR